MSFFGFFKKNGDNKNTVGKRKMPSEPSAIEKMKKMVKDGYGFTPSEEGFEVQAEDEMSDDEYRSAIDKLFPIRLTDFCKALESGIDPFPIKTDMVDMSVPTMDDINGGKQTSAEAQKP